MIKLKQLIEASRYDGMSDIQVIEAFFTLNDMEEEGIDLVNELTKSKIEKLKQKQRIAKDWFNCLPSKYLYENYDLDTADKLHNLELNFIINGGELSNSMLKWACDNVPKIKRPEVYFNPLVEYLSDKGISFKKGD